MDPAAIMNGAANTTSFHLSEIWQFPPPNSPDALGLRRPHFAHGSFADFAPGPTRDADPASIAHKKPRHAAGEEEESAKGASTTNAVVPHSMISN